MDYQKWERTVPESIRSDQLWDLSVYRAALYLGDLCWNDVTRLSDDWRTAHLASQLYETVAAVGAGIAEGRARRDPRDRARAFEAALAAARASRERYLRARFLLAAPVSRHRMELLEQIAEQLQQMLREEHGSAILAGAALVSPHADSGFADPPLVYAADAH